MEVLTNLMTIIDKNHDNISEGDYLDICNGLKDLYKNQEAPKGKWDGIMYQYAEWKRLVRMAIKSDAIMQKVNVLYKEYEKTKKLSDELSDMCMEQLMKTSNREYQETEEKEAALFVRNNVEELCQGIVNDSFEDAYRVYKYAADDAWRELTKFEEFEEFLDLVSPVELYMHRALCEPQMETASRVYRQKEKIITHNGHYIIDEFKWISHERHCPEVDTDDDEDL